MSLDSTAPLVLGWLKGHPSTGMEINKTRSPKITRRHGRDCDRSCNIVSEAKRTRSAGPTTDCCVGGSDRGAARY